MYMKAYTKYRVHVAELDLGTCIFWDLLAQKRFFYTREGEPYCEDFSGTSEMRRWFRERGIDPANLSFTQIERKE